MRTSIPTGTCSISASVDLVKFMFVGLDGGVCLPGAKALGVCSADTAAGNQAPVDISGILVVMAGDVPIAPGQAVVSNAAGAAAPASAASISVESDITVGVNSALAVGSTQVTSDAATPTVTSTATAEADNDVTISGGVLPEVINGWALDGSSGAPGEFIRILRS